MRILDELERFQEAALNNKVLRYQILRTRSEEEPVRRLYAIVRRFMRGERES